MFESRRKIIEKLDNYKVNKRTYRQPTIHRQTSTETHNPQRNTSHPAHPSAPPYPIYIRTSLRQDLIGRKILYRGKLSEKIAVVRVSVKVKMVKFAEFYSRHSASVVTQ